MKNVFSFMEETMWIFWPTQSKLAQIPKLMLSAIPMCSRRPMASEEENQLYLLSIVPTPSSTFPVVPKYDSFW